MWYSVPGRRKGQVAESGPIPVILPTETFEAVAAVLRAPGRRTLLSPGRKYLLSGLLSCGRCGTNLLIHSNGKLRTYACLKRVGGCGSLGIVASAIEEYIVDEAVELLDSSTIEPPCTTEVNEALTVKLRADEAALAELTRVRFVERLITDEEYRGARAELADRISKTRRQMEPINPSPAPEVQGKAREVWASSDLQGRRALLSAVLERVVIHPATRRGRGLDRSRVEPVFRA